MEPRNDRPEKAGAGSLDDFLALSRSAGTYDSESEFTVDLRHAFERLKRFTLAESGGYVRFLVASAIARGANEIALVTTARQLQIKDNGNPLTRQDLESVFPSLLASARPKNLAHRYLAVGLWGARNWGFHEAQVCFPQASLQLTQDQVDISSRSEDSGWNTLQVIEKKSVGKILGSLVADRGWEHLKAGLRCLRYATARITLNGQQINVPHPCHDEALLELQQETPGLSFQGRLVRSLSTGIPLTLVVHGVCYEPQNSGSLSGLIFCDDLMLDASFQGLVQNKALSALTRTLRHQLFESMLEQLARLEEAEVATRLALQFLHSDRTGTVRETLIERAVLARPNGPLALRTLEAVHQRASGLVLGPILLPYKELLEGLFHTVVWASRELNPEVKRLLATPAVAMQGFENGDYCLRLSRPGLSAVPHYSTHFFADQQHLLAAPLGPDGFQLINLRPDLKLSQAGAYLETKILEMGNQLCEKIDRGLIDPNHAAPFFARVLHWIRSSDRFDARFVKWRHYLRFRREPDLYASLDQLRRERDLTYRMVDEPEAPLAQCLVLTLQELELLEWEGVTMRPHVPHSSGRIGGMRVIELQADE